MTCLHLDGARWNPGLPTAVPVLVASVELTEPIKPIQAPGSVWAYLLVRARRRPVGWITCRVADGWVEPAEVTRAVTESLVAPTFSALLYELLRQPVLPAKLAPDGLFAARAAGLPTERPLITVVVCTRDRPYDLQRCLRSLERLDYAPFEVVVVDSAPSSEETCRLVTTQFPGFRYGREERGGLNRARSHGLALATGALIAYTDDDVVVDSGWLAHVAEAFNDEAVAVVTGLIAPLELQSDSQLQFEVIGGFGRGCRREWYRIDASGRRPDIYHLGAGRFGAGANMAFRVSALSGLGGFDPTLDVGTPTEGGGDLEIFFRMLHEGAALVYEPAAIVWHRHRTTAAALAEQINTWGTAMGAFLTAAFVRYPRFRLRLVKFGLWWSWFGYLRPVMRSLVGPGRVPRYIRFGPLRRLPLGPFRYLRSRRQAGLEKPSDSIPPPASRCSHDVALCEVDLATELPVLAEAAGCRRSEVRVFVADEYLGTVGIENRGYPIYPSELRTRVSEDLRQRLLDVLFAPGAVWQFRNAQDILHAQLARPRLEPLEFRLALASIVVATRNRPTELRRCLASLATQVTRFPFEIVVVDNAPGGEATPAVVGEFPGARYVVEPVRGLARARNTGFRHAKGEILVATDDDVLAPPNWLQELVQPFRYAHVGIATGQVLALSLRHAAQRDFESQGGLGKGPTSFEVDLDWLAAPLTRPPRVWDLGATANAAFRRTTLQDPRVGLLDESLGPGTPAGGGEDAYLFYRALAAGYGIHYSAAAALFHEHRATAAELRRQMFDYGRGHVSYLLTTLFSHGDLRTVSRLIGVLPAWHLWRLLAPGAWRPPHARGAVVAELAGFLAGPFCWLISLLRERALRARRASAVGALPMGELRIGGKG